MGYFPVKYDSRVVIYKSKMFIRLATGLQFNWFGFYQIGKYFVTFNFSNGRIQTCETGGQLCSLILSSNYSECSLSVSFDNTIENRQVVSKV